MGDAADNLLDGTCCGGCGELIDGASPGHSRTCAACVEDDADGPDYDDDYDDDDDDDDEWEDTYDDDDGIE